MGGKYNRTTSGQHSDNTAALWSNREAAMMWAHAYFPPPIHTPENLLSTGTYTTPIPTGVTESMEAQARLSDAVNKGQIQAMQQAQMNAAQANLALSQGAMTQNQVMSFNRADPFTLGPSQLPGMSPQMMAQAHHQLMQVNQMNPYIASALSRGGMGGRMIDPQYASSPRYGLLRDPYGGREAAAFEEEPGLFRDFATLSNYRTYALYEDPAEAISRARGRMTQRAESYTGAGVGAAALGAALMMPGPGWLALPLAITAEVGASMASDAYFGRRAQAQRIRGITEDIVTAGPNLGPLGRGVSHIASNNIMRGIRQLGADSPVFNQEDMEDILRTSADMGAMQFVGNEQQILSALKEQAEMLKTFMRITGDPDLRNTFQRMAQFQNMGLMSGSQQSLFLNNIQAFARMAGVDYGQVMSQGGQMGMQQALDIGATASMGTQIGSYTQGAVRVMQQRQALTPQYFASRGGPTGVQQAISGSMIQGTHTALNMYAPALIKMQGGKLTPDMEMVERLVSGEYSPEELIAQSYRAMEDPAYRSAFALDGQDAIAELQTNMSPLQHVKLQRARVTMLQNLIPGMSEDQAWRQTYGNNWRAIKGATEGDAIIGMRDQMMGSFDRQITADYQQKRIANRYYNLRGSQAAKYIENLQQSLFGDLIDRTAREQHRGESLGWQRSEIMFREVDFGTLDKKFLEGEYDLKVFDAESFERSLLGDLGPSVDPSTIDQLKHSKSIRNAIRRLSTDTSTWYKQAYAKHFDTMPKESEIGNLAAIAAGGIIGMQNLVKTSERITAREAGDALEKALGTGAFYNEGIMSAADSAAEKIIKANQTFTGETLPAAANLKIMSDELLAAINTDGMSPETLQEVERAYQLTVMEEVKTRAPKTADAIISQAMYNYSQLNSGEGAAAKLEAAMADDFAAFSSVIEQTYDVDSTGIIDLLGQRHSVLQKELSDKFDKEWDLFVGNTLDENRTWLDQVDSPFEMALTLGRKGLNYLGYGIGAAGVLGVDKVTGVTSVSAKAQHLGDFGAAAAGISNIMGGGEHSEVANKLLEYIQADEAVTAQMLNTEIAKNKDMTEAQRVTAKDSVKSVVASVANLRKDYKAEMNNEWSLDPTTWFTGDVTQQENLAAVSEGISRGASYYQKQNAAKQFNEQRKERQSKSIQTMLGSGSLTGSTHQLAKQVANVEEYLGSLGPITKDKLGKASDIKKDDGTAYTYAELQAKSDAGQRVLIARVLSKLDKWLSRTA